MCQKEGYVSSSEDFRGRGRPWGLFFGFYKTRHILLSDSANSTVLRAVVLTQYRRVTDGQMDKRTDRQTDGIAVASTALAMLALGRAVKWAENRKWALPPVWGGELGLHQAQCGLLPLWRVFDPSSRLATIDTGRKLGMGAPPPF